MSSFLWCDESTEDWIEEEIKSDAEQRSTSSSSSEFDSDEEERWWRANEAHFRGPGGPL